MLQVEQVTQESSSGLQHTGQSCLLCSAERGLECYDAFATPNVDSLSLECGELLAAVI